MPDLGSVASFISSRTLKPTSQASPCALASPATSAPSSTHQTFLKLKPASPKLLRKNKKLAPKLAFWLEGNIIEGLTVFKLPEHFRRRLRTSNMCERVNREIKRRTRVAGLFPNESSVLRLLTAILMETSDEWETGRAYFSDPSQS